MKTDVSPLFSIMVLAGVAEVLVNDLTLNLLSH